MTLRDSLCGTTSLALGSVKRGLLHAADQIGRWETAVCEANNSCLSQSIPAASHHPIFTFNATQLLPLNSSNPVISLSPSPPPPPPPCKTIFGPIFQVTPPVTFAAPTPHPAYMWMEEKLHIATELIESAWGNDRLLGVKNALAWFRSTVDIYSEYFLPMILVMLGYSFYVMVTRVKRASLTGSEEAKTNVVDDAKVVVVGPNNLPKRRLHSLCTFLISALGRMVFTVIYPVIRLTSAIVYVICRIKLAFNGFGNSLAQWFHSLFTRRAAPPATPISNSPPPSLNEVHLADLHELLRRYAAAEMAGCHCVQCQKGKSPNHVAVKYELD
ncbi:hypothetical protein FRC03_003891 [Tulasnella sp. 419]|nr:hypothetical protein FRC03_003891 [Tulasnella sp. 419]